MSKKINSRAIAAQLSWQIIDRGQSLDAALGQYFEATTLSIQDRGFIQELVYGVCRWYGALDNTAHKLLKSPIRKKDRVVHYVLLVGLYQLGHLRTAEHAAVSETVNACIRLKKPWAKNLINGCLRTFLRQTENHENDHLTDYRASHPMWMQERFERDWPNHIDKILQANNLRPPMCLRVNRIRYSVDQYLQQLSDVQIQANPDPFSNDGIILQQAVSVESLPGFYDGAVSVQDSAAQLACEFLRLEQGQNVLDACAAPGGKTAHALEKTNDQITMTALDISELRCGQLHNTLDRLKLDARVYCADAALAPTWPTPDSGYDRILIDAPCSGTGVIRRHPDIKHHRTIDDIAALRVKQRDILQNLWPLLKSGGYLLYLTCSIFSEENEQQISQFLGSQNDAMLETIKHPNALTLSFGSQTLPGVHDMDGFYYALLHKKEN
ncbi:MAG: 16S rRNA (cytosine(967)-C(5))-methyltransferase RsmB [Acidiferrobacterales bacterium]|nr:16S rRNA (cytosine(967)-C(5))-methyltransferase RsmB [Acidiferrobacterales bacterium]